MNKKIICANITNHFYLDYIQFAPLFAMVQKVYLSNFFSPYNKKILSLTKYSDRKKSGPAKRDSKLEYRKKEIRIKFL